MKCWLHETQLKIITTSGCCYKSEPINIDCNNLVRNPGVELKKNGIWMQKDFICVSFELINPTTGIVRWLETWKFYEHLKYL